MFFLETLLFVLIVASIVYACRSICGPRSSSTEQQPTTRRHQRSSVGTTRTNTSNAAAASSVINSPSPPITTDHPRNNVASFSEDKEIRRTHFGLVSQSGVILKTSPDEVMADFGIGNNSNVNVVHKDNTVALIEPTCSICLVEYEHGDDIRRSFHCNHIFHSQCILDWLVEHQPLDATAPTEVPAATAVAPTQENPAGPQCPCCRCEFITQADLDLIPEI